MLQEIKTKKLLRDKILSLKKSLDTSKIYHPENVSKLVFLCGANKDKDCISERRKALIEFSKIHLRNTQFILAERMFFTLQKEGEKGNILDVENNISKVADHIIIILESPSAFAELGAFTHTDLREKLIVINDKKYEYENSFINLGPIKAIKELPNGKQNIIHYKMRVDGIDRPDAIGEVFEPLFDLLKPRASSKRKRTAINTESCDPSINFDKNTVMFIHDLIYFTGPISRPEIIEILILIFGPSKNFKNISEHLGILTAIEYISVPKEKLYRSNI